MNLWTFSVKRPIGITMLTLIVLVLGFVSLTHLPIDLMPDMTYPTISISASYANASPVEVETLITRPIEQALSAVTGVEELSSTSTEGSSRVRVTFTWGTDLDAAANDIRDRIDRIISRLPEEVERPTLRKFDLSATPIMVIGAAGDLDPVQMLKLIEDQVKYRIERIPGVASLDVQGGRKRQIHVNLKLGRLKALGLKVEGVIARLKSENLSLPAGFVEAGNHELIVRTPGEFYKVEQLRDVVVKEDGNSIVRLGEVAEIDDRWEKIRSIVRVNGKPGVRLSIQKQSGKNTVEVADGVTEEIRRINRDLPQLHLTTIMDTSKYIRQSISNVTDSAVQGGILAIVILLFFLGDIRSTLIIGTSIPISIIATFVLMYFNGFTLNVMSLGGVALGIGMLVDNAIVVLENIFRWRELGHGTEESAIGATEEVAMPIIASTVTTVVVFLPLLFVQGMTGVMFKQLSFIVCFSLVCSLVSAVTLVPMLCAKIMGASIPGIGANAEIGTGIAGLLRRFIRFFEKRYLEILGFSLRFPWLSVILVTLVTLGVTRFVGVIGTEFMPAADEGEVRVTAELEVGTRLSLVEEKIRLLEDLIARNVPERVNIVSSVGGGMMGGGHGGGVNTAEFRVPLVPRLERRRSSDQVAAELRKALGGIPGVKIRTRSAQGMFFSRMGGGTDKIQVVVRGHNLDLADQLAKQTRDAIYEVEGIADVRLSRESGAPERLISIDRSRAADLKLTVQRVAEFLGTILSGTAAGNFRESGDEYRILVKSLDPERLSLDQILDLTLLNSDGRSIAIRNVASIVERQGPLLIERLDQERIVNVTADPGLRPIGAAIADVQERIRKIPLPEGFNITLEGDYQEQQKSFRELLLSFGLAIFLVYMVMAIQYESLLDPLIVMVTVPLSAIGVILALLITHTTFNVQSFIGCIMLGGIVVNNSILLVDHANLLFREKGLDLLAALKEAGRDRFRPVLMTAFTAILGLVPLALGWGEGGEVQAPMARVVIGGLVCATVISLVIIPTVYLLFYRRSERAAAQAGRTVLPVIGGQENLISSGVPEKA